MAPAYPSVERAREDLVEAGRAMRSARLVVAREGNLTPTGVDKARLEPSRLVELDLDGNVRGPGRASTETGMHLEIYRRRPDVGAIAHGHPPHATAFAVAGRALDACLLPEVILTLGCVPLSRYATPSTPEVAEVVAELCADHDAFLLRNHGAVALAGSAAEAVERLELVEQLATITWLAEALGGARALDRDQVQELRRVWSVYGVGGSLPDCRPSD
jgi:L-fuculose-phosphate aldolase